MNFPFPKEKFLAILFHLASSPLNQPWRFTANLGLKVLIKRLPSCIHGIILVGALIKTLREAAIRIACNLGSTHTSSREDGW